MFTGRFCRYLRDAHGQIVPASMGTMSIEDYVDHMIYDARSPDQLDDLAEQFLLMGRRAKSNGFADVGQQWKSNWRRAKSMAAEARARIASFPAADRNKHLFMNKTVGAPGQLFDDVRLPNRFRLHLPLNEVSTGIYSPPLRNQAIYTVAGLRNLKAFLLSEEQIALPPYKRVAIQVEGGMLRGMLDLGMIEAIPNETRLAA